MKPLCLQFQVAYQTTDALAHLHARGILHLDVSPFNIMRSRTGVYKMADFGISQVCVTSIAAVTQHASDAILGNFAYMAPEQAFNPSLISFGTDIWALGATLLHAWTGQRPHRDASRQEIFGKLMQGVPPSLGCQERPLPTPIRSLLTECFQLKPEQRPAATVLLQSLAEAQDMDLQPTSTSSLAVVRFIHDVHHNRLRKAYISHALASGCCSRNRSAKVDDVCFVLPHEGPDAMASKRLNLR